jgi:hypothetical protein
VIDQHLLPVAHAAAVGVPPEGVGAGCELALVVEAIEVGSSAGSSTVAVVVPDVCGRAPSMTAWKVSTSPAAACTGTRSWARPVGSPVARPSSTGEVTARQAPRSAGGHGPAPATPRTNATETPASAVADSATVACSPDTSGLSVGAGGGGAWASSGGVAQDASARTSSRRIVHLRRARSQIAAALSS